LGERAVFCFAGKEIYDIMLGGKKIGGNAQRRLKDVIFQHGSIPVANHAVLGAEFLREPPVGIEESAGALHDFGVRYDHLALKKILLEAFMETHAAVPDESSLTIREKATADSLVLRHASAEWVWDGIEIREER
jgi:lipoate-protein ligase A